MPLSLPIVLPMGIEIFGKAHMSKIASVVGVVTALAVAVGGPPIGGVIIEYASWRWVFGINVPLTIVAFLIVAMGVRESYDESLAGRIDLPEIDSFNTRLGWFNLWPTRRGRQYGWQSGIILGTLIGGVLAIGLFIFIESKVKHLLLELGFAFVGKPSLLLV
ncbi:MFS transporter [Lactiplantibacillus plantarum]